MRVADWIGAGSEGRKSIDRDSVEPPSSNEFGRRSGAPLRQSSAENAAVAPERFVDLAQLRRARSGLASLEIRGGALLDPWSGYAASERMLGVGAHLLRAPSPDTHRATSALLSTDEVTGLLRAS